MIRLRLGAAAFSLLLPLLGAGSAAAQTPSPTPSPTPTDSASPAPVPSSTSAPAPSPDPTPTPSGTPTASPVPEGISIRASTDTLVAPVGSSIVYRLVVTNTMDVAIPNFTVRDLVPPEVTVEGVPIIDTASSIQLGFSPAGEDIVWTFDDFEPGASVELTWTGRVIAAGDLRADNRIEAVVRTRTIAAGEDLTYLGRRDGSVVRDAPRVTVEKEVVRTRHVTHMLPSAGPAARAALGAAGRLPVTGAVLWPWLVAALALVGSGSLLWLKPRRTVLSCLVLALLAGVACVNEHPLNDSVSPSSVPLREAHRAGITQDRVLGLLIHNAAPVDEVGVPEVPVQDVLVPVTVPIEVTENVAVPLPVAEASDRDGDNTVAYTWDAEAASIVEATSARLLTALEGTEVLLDIALEDGAIHASASLRNVSTDRRIHVSGFLEYRVTAVAGPGATFTSDHLDAVLEPGGEVRAAFSHLLPSGDYSAVAAFVAD